MTHEVMPVELRSILGSTPYDFAFKGKRKYSIGSGIMSIIIGIIWLWVCSMFEHNTLLSFFDKGPITVSDIFGEAWFSLFFIGIGLLILISGIVLIFLPGSWFVGIANFLIIHEKRKTKRVAWHNISKYILSTKNGLLLTKHDARIDYISHTSFTGKQTKPRRCQAYNHIVMNGITDVQTVRQIIEQRIKEHEATQI
jgi:hypothetical protein